jgi:hypothetical protein
VSVAHRDRPANGHQPAKQAPSRALPADLDAEASVLGAMLLGGPNTIEAVTNLIGPSAYYRPGHADIHQAIVDSATEHGTIDLHIVASRMRDAGSDIEGRYLLELQGAAPAISTAATHARTLARLEADRRIIYALADAQAAAMTGADPAAVIDSLSNELDRTVAGLDAIRSRSSWEPVDLTPILSGDYTVPAPTICRRTDGHGLIYPGHIHSFAGEPESLKSWLVQCACAEQVSDGRHVVYLDFEDQAAGVVPRLQALRVPDELIAARFHYAHPESPLEGHTRHLDRILADGCALLVIDGMTEAMALHGLDPQDNGDTATFMRLLPRRATAAGAAVVIIDHVTKDRETRGRWAIGAQHKLAALDGAAYQIDVVHPFGKGRRGLATITVAKDRPGGVRAVAAGGKYFGQLELDSKPDGAVAWHLHPPRGDDEVFRPTALMERISRAVEMAIMPLSQQAILGAVKGDDKAKRLAIEMLVGEGYIAIDNGPRNARLHRSAKPYRSDDDPRSATRREGDDL